MPLAVIKQIPEVVGSARILWVCRDRRPENLYLFKKAGETVERRGLRGFPVRGRGGLVIAAARLAPSEHIEHHGSRTISPLRCGAGKKRNGLLPQAGATIVQGKIHSEPIVLRLFACFKIAAPDIEPVKPP